MPVKIERLTADQTALLPVWRDEWTAIGLSTEPADRERAERGIARAYEIAGLPPPEKVVWCDSPFAMCVARAICLDKHVGADIGACVMAGIVADVWAGIGASVENSVVASVRNSVGNSVRNSVGASVEASVRDSVRASVRASVWDSVGANVWANVWASVGASVGASVEASVRDSVRDSVRASVWDSVGANVWASVRDSVRDSVLDSVYGQHDAHWLGFHDFFRDVTGLSDETSKMQGLNEIARSAGWWLPHEQVCWVSERPRLMQRDEQGRLHSLTGPALRYPDGWSIYAVHGLRVPSEFIEDREKIDPRRALTEPNAEHRRALTQILGWDRVLQHVDLSEVSRDEYGVLLQTDTFNDDDSAPARFVRVSCTTTGRVYHFRVPPDCTTPRHALGWKYHPARPERGRDVDPLWYQPSAQS